jgi:A/G-specific adenine glycosylase
VPEARPDTHRRTARGARATLTAARAPRSSAAPAVDPAQARAVSRRLRAWFRRHGRALPWRATRDPYHVLVSELMLQQTQVARVVDYYARFLTRFPTLRHVAEAPPTDVEAAWAGLGYYARARNLHALARRVTADGTPGQLPSEAAALRTLPGVGRYTAGAVSSFAYERRAALVDTNVARVLARVFAPELTPRSARPHADLADRRGDPAATGRRSIGRTIKRSWSSRALVCNGAVRRCGTCP